MLRPSPTATPGLRKKNSFATAHSLQRGGADCEPGGRRSTPPLAPDERLRHAGGVLSLHRAPPLQPYMGRIEVRGDRASPGGPCDRGRWRGMRAALSTQLLASVKRRGHGGGFGSDSGAEWVIWALCTKACHMHPACAYARVSIQTSLHMQVTCLWRGHYSGGAVVKTPCGLHRHAQHAPFCPGHYKGHRRGCSGLNLNI